jgi:hypothetical protein
MCTAMTGWLRFPEREACYVMRNAFYEAVHRLGCGPFKNAQTYMGCP